MPKYDALFKKARKEVFLYVVTHQVLVHEYLGVLRERVEAGCKVKILLMSAKDSEGHINPNVLDVNRRRFTTDLFQKLEANTNALKEWQNSFNPKMRDKVEIRKYQESPTVTYTFIDKDETDGFLMVEILIPVVPLFNLPHYIVMRRDDEQFYKVHLESLNQIWGKAEPV